jgi:hypothetical protein
MLRRLVSIILSFSLIASLASGLKPKEHSPLDDIENHDEFNVADMDGLGGFEMVEAAYRKRGLKLPGSLTSEDEKLKEMDSRLRAL